MSPHKHLGRILVVRHETEARTHKRGHHERHITFRDEQRDDEHRNGADGRNAAGKAVEAVDEVDGVRDADDPQDCDGDGQPAEVPIRAFSKDVRVGERLDHDAEDTATSAAKICTQNLKYARSGDISSTIAQNKR